jgi:uncharacterized membrane protein YoaK (UPF0700 family)
MDTAGMTVLRDAWRTLVPDLDSRHGPLPPLLVALTVVSGLVDAFSYLILGHVFVANMTGNVVFVAFGIAGAPGFSIAASLVALAAFVVGGVIGGRIAHRQAAHRGTLLAVAVALECACVLIAFIVAEAASSPYSAGTRYPLITLLGVGMGMQNAAARALAVPDLTTTVLTMTITGMSADSRTAGGTDAKLGRRALSTLSLFVGGLVGAAIALHGSAPLTLLPSVLLLAATAVAAQLFSRRGGAWTAPA